MIRNIEELNQEEKPSKIVQANSSNFHKKFNFGKSTSVEISEYKSIPFNIPTVTGNEKQYVLQAINSDKISGDGNFSLKCHKWFEKKFPCKKALLTTSCTHALELSAILADIQPGDEVIVPSYTFVSTANAFVLRGAKIVFVDIRQDTMNIDEKKIEKAITNRTKVIVPVHYAGVACEMDSIMQLASKYNLLVIEDAAHALNSTYKSKSLGTIGHMAAFSFHETKNITSGGEGGLLVINDPQFIKRAEIIREKGTNRSQFFRGLVNKYTWVDLGSSYLMNDLSAAYLWGQLEKVDEITNNRLNSWNFYDKGLKDLHEKKLIEFPVIPKNCKHSAHMFFIKVKNLEERSKLLNFLYTKKINAVFHYIPLHSSVAGLKFGYFCGEDIFTTKESERLVRLPLFYMISRNYIEQVISSIREFFST